jgi:hypothetical protein
MRLDHPQTLEFIEMASLRGRSRAYTRVQKRAIARLIAALLRPLTAGVAGEPGSGKSALLNALLGAAILPVGGVGRVRPLFRARYSDGYAAYAIHENGARQPLNSEDFHRVSAGQAAFNEQQSKVIYDARGIKPRAMAAPAAAASFVEVYAPVPLLRQIEFVELPVPSGVGAALSPAARSFARADIVVWTTPGHQAWKRSELLSWLDLHLAPWDRGILAATHRDGLGPQDQEKLLSRLMRDTGAIFAACHLVSPYATELQESGFPQLERSIQELAFAVRQTRLARAHVILERIDKGSACPPRFAAASTGDAAQQSSQEQSGAGFHSAG